MLSEKEEARRIIESLPEHATWDDIMYQLYVKKKIDDSIKAAKEGRVLSHQEVKKRLTRR